MVSEPCYYSTFYSHLKFCFRSDMFKLLCRKNNWKLLAVTKALCSSGRYITCVKIIKIKLWQLKSLHFFHNDWEEPGLSSDWSSLHSLSLYFLNFIFMHVLIYIKIRIFVAVVSKFIFNFGIRQKLLKKNLNKPWWYSVSLILTKCKNLVC